MKILRKLLILTCFIATTMQAQLIESVSDFNKLCSSYSEFDASFLIDGSETLLSWEERITSFTIDNGIMTYVAYNGNEFVGTLSLKEDKVFGELYIKDMSYSVASDNNGFITFTEQKGNKSCSVCNNNCGDINSHKLSNIVHIKNKQLTDNANNKSIINNNDVLRKYRLALLVDYWNYRDNKLGAETLMASVEAFLNEIYYRDFGICFEIVKNDKLTPDTMEEAVFPETSTGMQILSSSSSEFDKLISPEDYDIGFVVHPMSYETGVGVGWAYVSSAYRKHGRTQGVAHSSHRTIAHEMGHMFGAGHTFIEMDSYQTELGDGQSLMGTEKAFPRDFISLVTLQDMRQKIADKNFYFNDDTRSTVVMPDGSIKATEDLTSDENLINIVNGVKTNNSAPVIDTTKLKRTYIVPPGVYLQFRIPATDADGDELTYTAQQADINNESATHFLTTKGTNDSCVMIRKDYYNGDVIKFSDNTTETGKSYKFWLAASDPKIYSKDSFENDPHATAYDVYETNVQVKGSSKFAVNSLSPYIVSSCYEGYKVKINWKADTEIFDENSRFRILFSKNGGATYDYVIKDNIRALDETCNIYIPYGIGTGYYANRNGKDVYKCVLKLEHVDGVSFIEFPATTTSVGFCSYGTKVTFNGLPDESYIETTIDNIPQVPTVTSNNNGGADIIYNQTESNDGKYIFRTWETTYGNKTYGFEQTIKIIDGEETGINTIETDIIDNLNDTWFDLQGRPVTDPRNGVFIKQGEKRLFR